MQVESNSDEPEWLKGVSRPAYPVSLVNRLVRLADEGTVLEVAAGQGEIARRLAARGLEVTALEAQASQIEKAQALPYGRRVRWQEGPPERANLGGPYDVVVASDPVHRLDWSRALPKLGRASNGWFVAVGRGDKLDGGAKELDELLTHWVPGRGARRTSDEAMFVTKLSRFRRVGLWRARPQTVLQPVPVFVRSLHRHPGLSREELGPERTETFRRAVEAVVGQYHGGLVRLVVSPWLVWGRITRGVMV
ncbi:MAG: class I SAM-dependent methyltransferase [Myxococcota bacterium]